LRSAAHNSPSDRRHHMTALGL